MKKILMLKDVNFQSFRDFSQIFKASNHFLKIFKYKLVSQRHHMALVTAYTMHGMHKPYFQSLNLCFSLLSYFRRREKSMEC